MARTVRSAAVALGLAGTLVGACSPIFRPAPEPRAPAPLVGPEADAEGLAFTLMLADRRFYEPFTVRRLLVSQPDLRPSLALTLGRIGHPDGRIVLETLLEDRAPEVRREAAFGLGQLGDGADAVALLVAVADSDREVGVLAVEALARMGHPLDEVEVGLSFVEPDERWGRLLPSLFRFPPLEVARVARQALTEAPAELRPWAVYALVRRAPQGAADVFRELLGESDEWMRGWAARGLAVAGDRGDLVRLEPLLASEAPAPVVHALATARALVTSGRSAPPDGWIEPLLRLMADGRPQVRGAAIVASAGWLREARLSARLVELARGENRRDRELALVALAEGGEPRARDLIAEAVRSGDASVRAHAVEAAARAGLGAVVERLASDPEPRVRLAALGVRLDPASKSSAAAARGGLEDPDPAVQAATLEWLGEHPVVEVERLRAPLAVAGNRYMVHVGFNGVKALLRRAQSEGRERGVIVAMLEQMSELWDYPIRRQAAAALGELDRPEPPPGEFETDLGIRDYRELVRRTRDVRYVRVRTEHGDLLLALDCPAAPLTCENFLQLADQGFYDGLTFHRVAPGFLAQAGDPRGDGWGGPGYTVRDERNRKPFERGVLGMARSGPDTAGSQFFITLSRQPHLRGDYTAFGRVVLGEELLDRIQQGDVMQEVLEVAAPAAPDEPQALG